MTIVWHVDNMKISHKDSKVVTNIIKKLDEQYSKTASGKNVPLTVTQGKNHEYLGMKLDYLTTSKVRIDMREYIRKIMKELEHILDGWNGTAVTPAAEHLFKINDEAKK